MKMLTDYFLPYQRRWIDDDAPMKLYEKSRRVGITYATSFRAFQKCMTRRNFTQWVSSRDELTAKEFITDYIAKWCRLRSIVAKGLDGDYLDPVEAEKGIHAMVVEFPETGSRIMSLSSTPNAFAGKGGDVLLDEADLHKDPGTLIDMALPCTTWGGQLEVVSAYAADGSPNSVFAKLVEAAGQDNPMGWSLHRTNIADAVAEGFVRKLNEVTGQDLSDGQFIADMRHRCRTEAAWLSQYMCVPQDDGGSLLTYELITGCEDAKIVSGELTRGDPAYIGMDIGRKHDLTVLWVLQCLGDVLWTRQVRVLEKCPFREQLEVLNSYMRSPQVKRCCIDATGLGAMLAEEAQRLHGQYRVEAVNFSAPVKEELAMHGLRVFQDRQVRLPANTEIREDLHKTRKVTTAAGNVRYLADSDDAGHADRFWALMLGLHAAATGGGGLVAGETLGLDADPWEGGGRRGRRRPDNRDDYAPVGADEMRSW